LVYLIVKEKIIVKTSDVLCSDLREMESQGWKDATALEGILEHLHK
jgi:hypothetical protein